MTDYLELGLVCPLLNHDILVGSTVSPDAIPVKFLPWLFSFVLVSVSIQGKEPAPQLKRIIEYPNASLISKAIAKPHLSGDS